jgi:ATP-binding protein involved in chromosome partitioning
MSEVTESQVLESLRKVIDPDLGRDIVSLGFVQDLKIEGGKVSFRLVLTTPACPMKDKMKSESEKALLALEGVEDVEVKLDARTTSSRSPEDMLPGVKHVVLIGSGKGGVGKSTVAVNIAAALKKTGASVGIMDADIYGPSIPPMLGLGEPPMVEGGKMVPPLAYGMPVMSIGFMVRDDDALVWRGPILHKVLGQFASDVKWGELDYMIIDLPPGTGDVQISIAQLLKASGALLVTTPQDIAFRDVRRAGVMFHKVSIPLLGLVENMAFFVCPSCGVQTDIFPHGKEDDITEILPGLLIERLARFPIEPAIAASSESGVPIVISHPESKTAERYCDLASRLAQKLAVLAHMSAEQVAASSAPTDQD